MPRTKQKKKTTVKKKVGLKSKKKVVRKTAAKRRPKKVLAIPKGYSSITPYLIVNDCAKAIEFYKKIFGAKEAFRMERGGKIAHTELKIGDARIMLSDGCPEMGAHSPEKFGGSPVSIHFYTKNVDDVIRRAVAAGAQLKRAVQDMFYGDRSGVVTDPFGHQWFIATHVEDVPLAKIKKRAAELFGA